MSNIEAAAREGEGIQAGRRDQRPGFHTTLPRWRRHASRPAVPSVGAAATLMSIQSIPTAIVHACQDGIAAS
jgi:hypothetical protein